MWHEIFYVPGCCACMRLTLSRTLVPKEIASSLREARNERRSNLIFINRRFLHCVRNEDKFQAVYFFVIAVLMMLTIAARIKIIPSTVTIDDPAGKS